MMSKEALEEGGVCRSDLHNKADRRESEKEKTQSECGFYRFGEGVL